MDFLFHEFFLGLPDWREIARVAVRLLVASLLGAVIGRQREHVGKPAGLRTHMIVCVGATLFVLAPVQLGMNHENISRVIQGLAAGMGFLGAGAIIKVQQESQIQGLTTAAGIWLTAAVGVAVGLGTLGVAIIATVFAWAILELLIRFESQDSESSKAAESKPHQ